MVYPWNVGKLHTNTQYLLGELGRYKLVRDSKTQEVYKNVTGEYKAESPTCMKPTPVLQSTVSLYIRICNDSTSKLIKLYTGVGYSGGVQIEGVEREAVKFTKCLSWGH